MEGQEEALRADGRCVPKGEEELLRLETAAGEHLCGDTGRVTPPRPYLFDVLARGKLAGGGTA